MMEDAHNWSGVAMSARGANPGERGIRAYLTRLREGQRISQKKLAEQIGLSERAVIGYEGEEQAELKQSTLVRAVMFLGGQWKHIEHMVETNAGAEEGLRLASQVLSSDQQRRLAQDAAEMTDEELAEAEALIRRLRADPRRFDRLLGYGRRLVEESSESAAGGAHAQKSRGFRPWLRRKRDG